MRRRGVRLILVLGFAAATAAAGYLLWTLDAHQRRARAAQSTYDTRAAQASDALGDTREGLEAYVANGQQAAFWAPRVATALENYRLAVGQLQRLAPASALDAALQVSDELAQLDRRAREMIDADQGLAASDLVFADGLQMLQTGRTKLDEARTAHDAATAGTLTSLGQQQLYVLGGALVVTLLVVLLLAPAGPAREAAPAELGASGLNLHAPAPTGDADAALGAALDARLSSWRDTTGDAPRAETPTHLTSPAATLDLAGAADLCVDLGRVADAASLGPLLERTVALLGAKGLTLWIADPTGAMLNPTAAHGYGPQALVRLRALRREDDTATSTAFRTATMMTVNSEGDRAGAMAVPLVTLSGCVGVMAAEMTGGRERDETARSLARIVAAQLATLIPAAPAAGASNDALPRAAESR